MNTSKLNREFAKLNKEYIALDKQNDNEKDENVLNSNYDRMDEIQKRMAEISNLLEGE